MSDLESSRESAWKALLRRTKVVAPKHLTPVFHETNKNFLRDISVEGLVPGHKNVHLGAGAWLSELNFQLDQLRPPEVIQIGVGRKSLYAYPFLDHGHGFGGVDAIYRTLDSAFLRQEYEEIKISKPEWLIRDNIQSFDEYVLCEVNRIRKEKLVSTGLVLEVWVDPENAWVFDSSIIEKLMQAGLEFANENSGSKQELEDLVTRLGLKFWENRLTLKQFLDLHLGGSVSTNSETGYIQINRPEVLIGVNIAPEFLRILD
jgi:hypothetical protein